MTEAIQKRLKFADGYVLPVLRGEKTATVRYDPDEDIQVGDTVAAAEADGVSFANLVVHRTATVSAIEALSTIELFDAKYDADAPMEVVEGLNRHYDVTIRPSTTVRVYTFEVVNEIGRGVA